MKATEAVREIMKEQEVTLTQLAHRMQKSTRLTSDRLRSDNITIEKLNEILSALDCKIIIVPRDTRLPKDSYEVE